MRRILKILGNIINGLALAFVITWPVGIFIASFYENRIKENTLNAPNFKLYPDWLVIAFWFFFFLWYVAILWIEFKKRKKNKNSKAENEKQTKEFQRQLAALNEGQGDLKATFANAPNFKVFRDSRSFFDRTIPVVEKLQKHEEGIKNGNELDTNALFVALQAINLAALELANSFFDKRKIEGANFMLYLKVDQKMKSKIEDITCKSEKLYFRTGNEPNLLGILHLLPKSIKMKEDRLMKLDNFPCLAIPVYTNSDIIYRKETSKNSKAIIPGALLAYYEGTSMVSDTTDLNKHYSDLNEFTKEEIKSYFSKGGDGIKSFASFRIPEVSADGKTSDIDFVGIFNLDSGVKEAFGPDYNFFGTFYTMIYPTLKMVSKYLKLYQTNLLSSPLTEVIMP